MIWRKDAFFLVLTLIVLVDLSECGRNRIGKRFLSKFRRHKAAKSPHADLCAQFSYFTQNVDHFNFNPDFNKKYDQRYILSDVYWRNASGPIFFYTGNEGDIQWFCENTGFVWEIAKQFNALVVFAEHRYYGSSLPFGNSSFDNPYIHFLSSQQALADYAYLIKYLKSSVKGARNSPVIAFGGSYGGMLSAWFRMKYPNIVAGALAASAPIWQFTADCGSYSATVTSAFERANPHCPDIIRQSWDAINSMSSTPADLEKLSQVFRLCDTLDSGETLKDWLSDMYGDIAMANYPYASDFLSPLPAWPVKAMCDNITSRFMETADNSPIGVLDAIVRGINLYQNYTGKKKCFDVGSSSPQLDKVMVAWEYQTCTEFVFPMCNDGKRDMFEPLAWNPLDYEASCYGRYSTQPRQEWSVFYYGSNAKDIMAHSNIVFSNGDLDPWYPGGVLSDINKSLVAILIQDGAHHLDLRSSNSNDPKYVIAARLKEIDEIQNWIEDWNKKLDN